ncbi:CHRM5 (predicted) [Pycnogonum litorale]
MNNSTVYNGTNCDPMMGTCSMTGTDSPSEVKIKYTVFEMTLIAIVAGALSLLTVIGNIMVMISFKLDKQLQTISNYFLLSLAIADLVIGLFSMPLFTMYTLEQSWPLGPIICDTWLSIDYLMSNASVLNLLIISFDRYFSVTRPLTYRARRTTKRAAFMIACAWVISLILWPPWIYAWPYIDGERKVPDNQCYIQFLETNEYVTIGTAVAAFYLPVTVMIVLYWRIWLETERRQKDLSQLQACKKEDSKKSSSSEDHFEADEFRRTRSDSSAEVDRTYVPTSWCIENPKYFEAVEQRTWRHRLNYYLRCHWLTSYFYRRRRQQALNNCDADSTSDRYQRSPSVTTPASTDTHLPCSSRTTSMSFRPDAGLVHYPATCVPPNVRKTDNMQMVPISAKNGGKNVGGKSSTVVAGTTNSTSVANAGSATAATNRSRSADSVFTILIKLPTQPSMDEDSVSEDCQPSIKMIMEEDESEAESSTCMQIRRSESESAVTGRLVDPLRNPNKVSGRSSEIGSRLQLNTKGLTGKQLAQHLAASGGHPVAKGGKKKKKHTERKQDRKAAKTLSAILLAFIITWTPYNVLVLLMVFLGCTDASCISQSLYRFSYYLCYINSTINPLCYALCNANFRRTYIRILRCKWRSRQHQTNRGYFN